MNFFSKEFPENFNFKAHYNTSYFCRYTNSFNKMFISSSNLPEEHLLKVENNLNFKSSLPIDKFELENENSDKVYRFENPKDLKPYESIVSYFKSNSNFEALPFKIEVENKIPKSSDINFIIHEFTNGNDKVLLFSRQVRTSISKEKNFYHKGKEDFKPINSSELYIFNDTLTSVVINENFFVFEYDDFIEIFKFKDHLKKHVNKVIELFSKNNIITNLSEFNEEINHYRHFKSLSKVSANATDITDFISANTEQIQDVCNRFDVFFTFDLEKKNFSVENETGLKIVIRIISDRSGFDWSKNLITYPSKQVIKVRK